MEERSGHGQDVAALLHDGDAPDDLARAVEVGDAASQVVADLEVADVLETDRLPAPVAADHEELELSRFWSCTPARSWYSRPVTSTVRPPAS